jgi:dimethylglycine dehydrogenase
VRAAEQRTLWETLCAAGSDLGLRPIGMRAQDSLRLEKGYGVWSLEYAPSYTAAMAGLERFIAFDKGEFIGRGAALEERARGPQQRLVLLAVDSDDADVTGFEPVSAAGRRVGFVTSGAYGHHLRQSLALAYVDAAIAASPQALTVNVIGAARPARILAQPPYDPSGQRLRS